MFYAPPRYAYERPRYPQVCRAQERQEARSFVLRPPGRAFYNRLRERY